MSRRDLEAGRVVESIRRGRWKLYDGALFDLRRDPRETADVSARHPEVVEALRGQLAELTAARDVEGEAVELDDETRKRLEALGYLGRGE